MRNPPSLRRPTSATRSRSAGGAARRRAARRPAIERLAVDGRGRLYVYLHPPDENAEDRAVDVFSPEGDLLFSGWMPATPWLFARDDHVLARRIDDLTGEENIVRYRLVAPF